MKWASVLLLVAGFVLLGRNWLQKAAKPDVAVTFTVAEEYSTFSQESEGKLFSFLEKGEAESAAKFALEALEKNERFRKHVATAHWLITQRQLKEHLATALLLQGKIQKASDVQREMGLEIRETWPLAVAFSTNCLARSEWTLSLEQLDQDQRQQLYDTLIVRCKARSLQWQKRFAPESGPSRMIDMHVDDVEILLGESHPIASLARGYQMHIHLQDHEFLVCPDENGVDSMGKQLFRLFGNHSNLEAMIYYEFANRKLEQGVKALHEQELQVSTPGSRQLFASSEKWYRNAIQCNERLHDQGSEQTAYYHLRYGMLLFHFMNRPADAKEQFQKAYDVFENSTGFLSTSSARTIYYQSKMKQLEGKHVEARELIQQAIEIAEARRDVDRFSFDEWQTMLSDFVTLENEQQETDPGVD